LSLVKKAYRYSAKAHQEQKRYSGAPYTLHLLVKKAYRYSAKAHQEQKRYSGAPYTLHLLEVAKILADLELDVITS